MPRNKEVKTASRFFTTKNAKRKHDLFSFVQRGCPPRNQEPTRVKGEEEGTGKGEQEDHRHPEERPRPPPRTSCRVPCRVLGGPVCQRKAAPIHWLINKLPLTKDRRPRSSKQYLRGRRTILSPTSLSLLQTMWAGTSVEAPQVGETDKGERGDSPSPPCPSLHAHMGSTEICIQLGNTRQLWLHSRTHAGCGGWPCSPPHSRSNAREHRLPQGPHAEGREPHTHPTSTPKLKPEVLDLQG